MWQRRLFLASLSLLSIGAQVPPQSRTFVAWHLSMDALCGISK